MKNLDAISQIRKQLGLTQPELAAMLGVSTGHLAMTETGKRRLPPEAFLRLLYLHQQFKNASLPLSAEINAAIEAEKELLCKELEKQIREAEFKLVRIDKKITEMISEYDRVQRTLFIIENEMKIFSGVQKYFSQLEKMHNKQVKILRNNLPIRRQSIETRRLQLSTLLVQLKDQLSQLRGLHNS